MKTKLLFLTLSCLLLLAATGFTQQPEGERKAGDRMVLTIKDVEYAFRWCPPGTFMMGSPEDEPGRRNNERQHRVTLTRGFWMLETPVTQAMWESVMGNNPSVFRGLNLPVETVTWNDAQSFVRRLNEMRVAPRGFRFSLPTEAQWEYACRAGTTTAFHFGNTLTGEQANFHDTGMRQTSEVGRFPANAWGLHDMHGNVVEWCLSRFGNYPRGAVTDPAGSVIGLERVARGGSWNSLAEHCRSASRYKHVPSIKGSHLVGFRLALVRAE